MKAVVVCADAASFEKKDASSQGAHVPDPKKCGCGISILQIPTPALLFKCCWSGRICILAQMHSRTSPEIKSISFCQTVDSELNLRVAAV